MKLIHNNKVDRALEYWMDDEMVNQNILSGLIDPIFGFPVFGDDPAILEEAERFRNECRAQGVIIPKEQSIVMGMVMSIASDAGFDLFDDMDLVQRIASEARYLRNTAYADNPYRANITITETKSGPYTLRMDSYRVNELFLYDLPMQKSDHLLIPKIAACDHEFKFPVLLKGEDAIMEVDPLQIETNSKPIRFAKGKVLCLGCGLGYYAYMVSRKENVENVTIVEKDADILHLFTECILPQFETKDKITVIHADPMEYLSNLQDQVYTICHVSDWNDNSKFETYLKYRKIASRFKKTKFTWHLEDGLHLSIHYAACSLLGDISFAEKETNREHTPDELLLREVLEDVVISTAKNVEEVTDPLWIVKRFCSK